LSTKLSRISMVIFIVTVLLGGSGILPAHAGGGGGSSAVQMEAWAGFDGNYKYGTWLPIWVELDNQGTDLEATVQVQINYAIFATPVSLPAGAHKVVPVYVMSSNFSRELKVQLVDSQKVEVASRMVSVSPKMNNTYMVGIIAAERGALAMLSAVVLPGQERPVLRVDFPLEELPERGESLLSLDLIVINDVDTTGITPSQLSALDGWIAQGGRLVIGGGAGAQRTLAGLNADWVPAAYLDLTEAGAEEFSPLADFAEGAPILTTDVVPASHVQVDDPNILVKNYTMSLVAEKKYDEGYVDFVALDLSQAPFNGWSATTLFWEALVSPGSEYPTNMPLDLSVRQMRSSNIPYALSNMPMLNLPSVGFLAILLGVYIILIGPVNYLILRKMKKLQLAWVTIPVMTILFASAAFGISFAMRGTSVVINQIALIEPKDEHSAKVSHYFGLFSPGESAYTVTLHSDGLASPLAGYNDEWSAWDSSTMNTYTQSVMTYMQSQPVEVSGITVSQWSMQNFMLENTWEDFGSVDAQLTLEGSHLVGTLTNKTSKTIKDISLSLGMSSSRLGDLAPGESIDVDLDLDLTSFAEQMMSGGSSISYRLYPYDYTAIDGGQLSVEEQQRMDLKRTLVQSVFENGYAMKFSSSSMPDEGISDDVILIGWLDDLPIDVDVEGQLYSRQMTGMYFTSVPYSVGQADQLEIPVGLVSGTMSVAPENGGACGYQALSVYLYTGTAEFEFQLPFSTEEYQVDTLKLNLYNDMGSTWVPGEVDLYDWSSETWVQLQDPVSGTNVIGDGSRYANESGVVRVRLGADQNNQGYCTYLNLGLDATRIKP